MVGADVAQLRRTRRLWPLAFALVLSACTAGPPDGGDDDAGDTVADDGGPDDAGAPPSVDGGEVDDGGLQPPTDAGPAADAGRDDAGAVNDAGANDAGVEVTEEAIAYCECVFVACHDDFHETFGVDDLASIEACNVFASGLPTVGMDVVSGDSLECRQHWCDAQPADCPSALGLNATCTDG